MNTSNKIHSLRLCLTRNSHWALFCRKR